MGVINIIEHCHAIKEETETQRDKVLLSRSGELLAARSKHKFKPHDFLFRSFSSWLIILKAIHWHYNTKHFLACYQGREIGSI